MAGGSVPLASGAVPDSISRSATLPFVLSVPLAVLDCGSLGAFDFADSDLRDGLASITFAVSRIRFRRF